MNSLANNSDIFTQRTRFLHQDLETINYFLKGLDLQRTQVSIERGLRTEEVARWLIPSIDFLFNKTLERDSKNVPKKDIILKYNGILKEDIKLLRWLLMSYGSTARWNEFSQRVEKTVERAGGLLVPNALKHIRTTDRELIEADLEYYTLMLRENSYYDMFGGPLLDSEKGVDGRKVVLRKSQKDTIFAAGGVLIKPEELLIKTELALHTLRKAVERYEADALAREGGTQSVGTLNISNAHADFSTRINDGTVASEQVIQPDIADAPSNQTGKSSRNSGLEENFHWLPLTAPYTADISQVQMRKLQVDVEENKNILKDVPLEIQLLKTRIKTAPKASKPIIAPELGVELEPKTMEGEEAPIDINELREMEHEYWKGIGKEHRMI